MMYELLPELWSTDSSKQAKRTKGKKRVQDIKVWLQCYALYVGVKAQTNPKLIPELMAYQISIFRASQEYEGAAWAAYDAAYRRQAAATGHQAWSKINPSLYTIILCFTGRARKVLRCETCLSATHKSENCSLAGDQDLDTTKRMRAVESAVVAFSATSYLEVNRSQRSLEVCHFFNEKQCRFRNCKYRHVCNICKGQHAAVDGPGAMGQGATGKPGPLRRENPHMLGVKSHGPY